MIRRTTTLWIAIVVIALVLAIVALALALGRHDQEGLRSTTPLFAEIWPASAQGME